MHWPQGSHARRGCEVIRFAGMWCWRLVPCLLIRSRRLLHTPLRLVLYRPFAYPGAGSSLDRVAGHHQDSPASELA